MSDRDEEPQHGGPARLVPNEGTGKRSFRASTATRRQMEALYQSLESALSDAGKVLAFTASSTGEGTTTIIRELTSFLLSTFNASVLIIDASDSGAAAQRWGAAGVQDLAEVVRALPPDGAAAAKRPGVSVASLPADVWNTAAPDVTAEFASSGVLRTHFDYILIDVPAIATDPAAVSIGRHADGVVIVVEAERTRWPVVDNTKRAYEAAGAKVLGVILNKRRFYIPNRIYNWL